MKLTACLVTIAVSSPVTPGQISAGQKIGLAQYIQTSYAGIKRDLLAAAEKMPEADYGFKPSQMSEARTYGAVIAHAADGMFGGCASARGLPNPAPGVEKRLTKKVDILNALSDSIAFCDEVFSGLTERSAGEFVKQGPVEIPRGAALMGLLAHNAEMFGISTVYLRAKNIVPPGSR